MPWKKGKDWFWDQSQWSVPKGRKKDTKNTKDGKVFMVGYDGRRIEFEGESGSSSHGWYAGSQEAQLKEENQKLKETMRNLMQKDTVKDVPKEVIDLVKEDPREQLKAKQKELNAERKALNRLCKVKEDMAQKEVDFRSWKDSISEGVRKEEKRYSGAMAELQEELKRLEKTKDGESDPEMLVIDSDGEEQRQETNKLKQELRQIKSRFQEYAEYTTQLEVRNAQMFDAMQAQMSQLIGAIQGSSLVGDIPNSSPKQEVKIPKTIGTQIKEESKSYSPERKRGRSRTPSKRSRHLEPQAELQYKYEDLEEEMSVLTERDQQRVLQAITTNPANYVTWESALALIQKLQPKQEIAAPVPRMANMPLEEGKAEGGTFAPCLNGTSLKEAGSDLPIALEHPCRPFRRFNGKDKMGPYTTPTRSEKENAKTPDGGSRVNMDLMS